MITHRDRIQACLRGELIDRPPVALWRHFPVDDQSPNTLTDAQVAFQSNYDWDLVKVTPASAFSVIDWGVEDTWTGNTEGTRTYTRRVIHRPQDWAALPLLAPSAPALALQLQCLRAIRDALGADTPILQTVFNPLSHAKHLAGDETLMEHMRTDPDAVHAGLRIITQSTLQFIAAVQDSGADGIFYAVQHAQQRLLSRGLFEHFSRANDLLLLDAARGMWCNVLHVHGEGIHFEAVCDYPAHIVNWHDRESGPPLDEAARLWPGALCGGLSRQTLVFGSAADVTAEAKQALSASCNNRLILSTGCVVPVVAPHGSLRAAARAARSQAAGPNAALT